jgi:hypothetical protein
MTQQVLKERSVLAVLASLVSIAWLLALIFAPMSGV